MSNKQACDNPGAKTYYVFIKAGVMTTKPNDDVIEKLFRDKSQVEKAVVSCSGADILDLIQENFDLAQ